MKLAMLSYGQTKLRLLVKLAAFGLIGGGCIVLYGCTDSATKTETVEFSIELETILKHDDGTFLWFHPRVTPIAPYDASDQTEVLMTLQKHLHVSDYYSGSFTMYTQDSGDTWQGPDEISDLAWQTESDSVDIAVVDVTPGWHEPTQKALAIGAQVRYSPQGHQLEDRTRAHQTAYAVYKPETKQWLPWKQIRMPQDSKFNFARSACAQWMTEPDGTVLLPFYISKSAQEPFSVTVARFEFDGVTLNYIEHGDILSLGKARGLYEPSLTQFGGTYYLTIRNDERGYVTKSEDGLNYEPIKPWTFDDGSDLGNYNTQQHWITHSNGLFLTYTRRDAENDHVMRHRAPLFIAQVEPDDLHVLRNTEQILVPERGATLGNFGAAKINEHESWVTVSEGVWNDDIRKHGAEGALFVARIIWSKPNEWVSKE